MEGDQVRISSYSSMRAITPGQVCVFYDDEVCLGGGKIDSVWSFFSLLCGIEFGIVFSFKPDSLYIYYIVPIQLKFKRKILRDIEI